MKKTIINGILAFTITSLAPQIIQAQGTVYLSNLGQASGSSVAVGSNSWLAAIFFTGTNAGGYVLNSIQLVMTDASGSPSGFTVMLYTSEAIAPIPQTNLGTLDGSADPVTVGTYTYTDDSNLILPPHTPYFIVLTAGTAVANGSYYWSLANALSYNSSDDWFHVAGYDSSSNGSTWLNNSGAPQFAVTATPVPEPSTLCLFALGGLGFLWHHRKAKTV